MCCKNCKEVEIFKSNKFSIAWYCHRYKEFLQISDDADLSLIKVLPHKDCDKCVA